MNLEEFVNDGIFRVKSNSPFVNYVVVKTYGNKQLKRAMESLEDVDEQIKEWDSEYGYDLKAQLKAESTNKVKSAHKYMYRLIDADGQVFKEGSVEDLANEFELSTKTIYNVGCSNDGRRLKIKNADGNNSYFQVEKFLTNLG